MCIIIEKESKRSNIVGYKVVLKYENKYYSPISLTLIKENRDANSLTKKDKIPFYTDSKPYHYKKGLKGFYSFFGLLKDAKEADWLHIDIIDKEIADKLKIVVLKIKASGSIKNAKFCGKNAFLAQNIISIKEVCEVKKELNYACN